MANALLSRLRPVKLLAEARAFAHGGANEREGEMATAARPATTIKGWVRTLSWIVFILCIGSVAAALIGAVGSGQGAWHFRIGFTVLRYAFYAAAGGAVLALIALIASRRRAKFLLINLVALIVAVGFLLYLGSMYRTARTVPAIHDVSTNLDDMPQFRRLTVRADNLENIPDMDRPELAAMQPEQRWKAIHREAYGDIRPVTVARSPAEVIERAESLARARGWEIAHVDRARGILEATDTTRFFRFKDDVVVRARPAPDGHGTIVDMRSISRVGGSDVGVNAARIRSFLRDLTTE
jgi:uncharacterized protein (DUF1499 family)